jgi:hypothetical protein
MPIEEEQVQVLVRRLYNRAEDAPWELSPEAIRAHPRRRPLPMPDPKALVLVGAGVALVVIGFVVFDKPAPRHNAASPPSSTTTTSPIGRTLVMPNVLGLTQTAAAQGLSSAGLTLGVITSVPSSHFPAGTVVATNPSAGSALAPGATVSVTVSSGPSGVGSPSNSAISTTTIAGTRPAVVPTTTPVSSTCSSGTTSITMNSVSMATCLVVGADLTVTFDSQGGWSEYGQWSSSPPTISDNSILAGGSYVPSGKSATAGFSARGAGTATVTAVFDNTCSPSDATPCTIPPATFFTLTVTVVPV